MTTANVERNGRSVVVSVLCWLIGLLFVVTGGTKLAGAAAVVAMFQHWGYPLWFMQVVGGVEIVGGIALLAPFSRIAGAMMLSILMIGAAGTHALFGQWAMFFVPIVLLALLVWIIQRTALRYQRAELSTHTGELHHPAV